MSQAETKLIIRLQIRHNTLKSGHNIFRGRTECTACGETKCNKAIKIIKQP